MGRAHRRRAEHQSRRNKTAQRRQPPAAGLKAFRSRPEPLRSRKSLARVSKLAFFHALPEGSAALNQGDPLGA